MSICLFTKPESIQFAWDSEISQYFMRMGRKKSEAVAGQNGRLQCESRLEIKQHTSWQVSVLVLFGSLFPFLTVPPPSPSLSLTCMQTQRGCVSFPASLQGSSPNVKSIVLSLPSGDRVTSTHTSVGRYIHPHT